MSKSNTSAFLVAGLAGAALMAAPLVASADGNVLDADQSLRVEMAKKAKKKAAKKKAAKKKGKKK